MYICNMEKEIYKDVPGYEGLYQVSNWGNVKSLSDRWGLRKEPRKVVNTIDKDTGYHIIILYKENKPKTFRTHQLVAMAFLGHQPDGTMNLVINHIDNNPSNNYVDNLELVTQRYNSSCHKKDVGVFWYKRYEKWQAQIMINKLTIYLGRYKNKEEAVQMYQKALANIHLYNNNNKDFRNVLH